MISVLIVDDDPLVRQALALLLGGEPDLEVVAEAGDGHEALELAACHRPDVVLMDIRMPGPDGVEATVALHSRPNPPRVIVLTTFDTDDHVVGAIAGGADGFLLKDTPPAEIVGAIRRVAGGEATLSPSATRSLVRQVRDADGDQRSRAARARLATLTKRELDVALAVGRGLSNADIGRELRLSVPTVKAHMSRLFAKLRVTNRVQIAIIVHDADLV